jgi:hypothetical protein
MKPGIVFLLSILISIGTYAQQKDGKADARWSLVYANDENGNRLAGDIKKLMTVVRDGEPIRISWTIEHPTNKSIKVEHFADAKFITILSDSVVFAQIDAIVGQTPSVKDKFITLKENIQWSFSASSNGKNDSMNLNAMTGEVLDHEQWKCGIKWFVNVR